MSLSTWFKFEVGTLNADDLRTEAGKLAEKSRGFAPDAILGIRTGGYHVALLMEHSFPAAKILPITCRRPSTGKKQASRLKEVIARLPHAITGRLRMAEHILLTQLRRPQRKAFTPDPAELSELQRILRDGSGKNILIVDDSVDSGATLDAVLEIVKAMCPAAQIKTAALTVTTASPLVEPDFLLYRYVLFRFPWSLDAQ